MNDLKKVFDAVAARGVVLNEIEAFVTASVQRNPEIPDATLRKVCLIGKGARCCRYIVGGVEGLTCAKHDKTLAAHLDARVRSGTFIAKGDNCEGLRVQ